MGGEADDAARRTTPPGPSDKVATVKVGEPRIAGALELLHEDADFVAIMKPSGLAVHRGASAERDTVVSRLRGAGWAEVFTVHRIDRGTSGVLLVARHASAARALSDAFASGEVEKIYVALVRGAPMEGEHVIDSPVPADEGGARVPALTRVTRLAVAEVGDSPLRERHYAWVEARPATGRFHQVRRHLKHLGHPIIGDANYGKSEHTRFLADRIGLRRLALHALRLELTSPFDGRRVSIEAPLPEDLARPLSLLGLI